MMSLTQQLVSLATTFCAAKNLSVSRVSTIVFNDGKVLSRIIDGADITTGRFEGALRWFSENWPVDVEWPNSISRPETVSGRGCII